MDCAACAVKIENAMKRLPGVSDINVSYSQEKLSLVLDADRTSEEVIDGKIRALVAEGFATMLRPGLYELKNSGPWTRDAGLRRV